MGKVDIPTWVIHGVFEKHGVVYHTHGLEEYGSLELELNLYLPENDAKVFINLIGLRIANGTRYSDGDVSTDLFNVPIVFIEAPGISSPTGEKHLRVVFPDANGLFPWDDGCHPDYANQLYVA